MYLASLSSSNHTILRATKIFKNPRAPVSPIRNSTGARTEKGKTDVFAKYLEKTFTPHTIQMLKYKST